MDFATYRKAWDNAGQVTPNIPLNLDLELAATCNLKCPFCFLQNKKYDKPQPPLMPKGLAKMALVEAADLGVPAVKMNWRGEATIHPDFSEITDLAHQLKFKDILVNTNGNYKQDVVYGMMNCTKVMFSVDSFDRKTYAKMRKGGNLDKVLQNIQMLIQFGHRNIWVRRVLTDSNKSEDFKAAAAQNFGDKVKVAEHHVFDRAKVKAVDMPRTYCLYPSQRLIVSTAGDVFPCCVDYFGEMNLGNIHHDSLKDIWNGYKIKFLRTMLKNNKFPSDQCKNCTSWMSYKAPEREKVSDKEL